MVSYHIILHSEEGYEEKYYVSSLQDCVRSLRDALADKGREVQSDFCVIWTVGSMTRTIEADVGLSEELLATYYNPSTRYYYHLVKTKLPPADRPASDVRLNIATDHPHISRISKAGRPYRERKVL